MRYEVREYKSIRIYFKISYYLFLEKLYFYLRHFLKAKDEHSIHSPFIFALYCEVICSKANYYAFNEIEKLRENLENNQQKITFEDLGAGANNFKEKTKTTSISKITRNSAKNSQLAQVLFRLVNYFQPKNLLDLGTSLGITTAYFAKTNSKTKITTFEGSKEIAEVAKQNFDNLKINNISIITGNLNQTFSKYLKEKISTENNENNSLDFVFFDANHQYLPTINYFETCLPYAHENTVFIFDDIYWSQGMKNAWETIKNHPKTRQTIDLYWFGIVFFRENQAKENFILKI